MISITKYHKGKFLSENEMFPENKECYFCKSSKKKRVFLLQKKPDVYMSECQNCYAISSERMPYPSTLSSYYSQYYDQNTGGVTIDDVSKFSKHIYNHIIKHIKYCNNIRILDFGGGSGLNSYYLALELNNVIKGNIYIDVVDYYKDLIKSDYNNIIIKNFNDISLIKDPFDIIIASAVIEHIPEGGEIIKNLFNLMKKDSIFYARTPFVVPILLFLNKLHIIFDLTFPAHVHDLGDKFWDNFINKMNISGEYQIIKSQPAIVETSYSKNFIRTLISTIFKALWYPFKFWKFVGGWEIFIKKIE